MSVKFQKVIEMNFIKKTDFYYILLIDGILFKINSKINL